MIMINPALAAAERKLQEEERELNQKQAKANELNTKINTVKTQMKAHENEIHQDETEITKLKQEIDLEKKELRRDEDLHKAIDGEIHTLRNQREQDALHIKRIAQQQADALKKEGKDGGYHSSTRF